MADIKPFRGVRPAEAYAAEIAALPYDVYNRSEAKEVVMRQPLSFLKIDRAETQFPDDTDMYSQQVYDKARDTLTCMINDGLFIQDASDCYYLYALTFHGRTQTGLVGCTSIDDYLNGVIRRHENTREEKELDRIHHIDTMNAQTGPIFLAYHSVDALQALIRNIQSQRAVYDFYSDDGIRHQVWKIENPETIEQITQLISNMEHLYIADGHHRAASAVKVGLKRREEHPDFDGSEEFNYFMSVLFPAEELRNYDYNRIVTGLNGYTVESLLNKIRSRFDVKELDAVCMDSGSGGGSALSGDSGSSESSASSGDSGLYSVSRPQHKGEIYMHTAGKWYRLCASPSLYSDDPVSSLDVSLLQNMILGPLLGIKNPKTDSRIQFVGGIRGLGELVRLADETPDSVAFAMYPTSMEELLRVADAGRLMPPKSTWFEPKLRSGLFIHLL